jgi:acyl carrier protein
MAPDMEIDRMELIRPRIRQFIAENYLFRDSTASIQDTDSLFETGIVDSFGVLNLVTFLEESFEIQVADDEVVPDNLSSIANMSAFVFRKLTSKLGAA